TFPVPKDPRKLCRISPGTGGSAFYDVTFPLTSPGLVVVFYRQPRSSAEFVFLQAFDSVGALPLQKTAGFMKSVTVRRSENELLAIAAFAAAPTWRELFKWPNEGHAAAGFYGDTPPEGLACCPPMIITVHDV